MTCCKYYLLLLIILLFCTRLGCQEDGEKGEKEARYEIVNFDWALVKMPMTISIWLFVACMAKLSKIHDQI
jgi:hypothetical protein